jgi:EAL domain-containing protein (putative c-di-GMP-specific phosphodiesterase class I)
VETEEQLAFLKRYRCHLAQGYLISRPMPAAELERALAAGLLVTGPEDGGL